MTELLEVYIKRSLNDGGFPVAKHAFYGQGMERVLRDDRLIRLSRLKGFDFNAAFEPDMLQDISKILTGTTKSSTKLADLLTNGHKYCTGPVNLVDKSIVTPLDVAVQLGRWHAGAEPSDMTYFNLFSEIPGFGRQTLSVLTDYLVLMGMPLSKEFAQAAYVIKRL
jgi:hypothetical protein